MASRQGQRCWLGLLAWLMVCVSGTGRPSAVEAEGGSLARTQYCCVRCQEGSPRTVESWTVCAAFRSECYSCSRPPTCSEFCEKSRTAGQEDPDGESRKAIPVAELGSRATSHLFQGKGQICGSLGEIGPGDDGSLDTAGESKGASPQRCQWSRGIDGDGQRVRRAYESRFLGRGHVPGCSTPACAGRDNGSPASSSDGHSYKGYRGGAAHSASWLGRTTFRCSHDNKCQFQNASLSSSCCPSGRGSTQCEPTAAAGCGRPLPRRTGVSWDRRHAAYEPGWRHAVSYACTSEDSQATPVSQGIIEAAGSCPWPQPLSNLPGEDGRETCLAYGPDSGACSPSELLHLQRRRGHWTRASRCFRRDCQLDGLSRLVDGDGRAFFLKSVVEIGRPAGAPGQVAVLGPKCGLPLSAPSFRQNCLFMSVFVGCTGELYKLLLKGQSCSYILASVQRWFARTEGGLLVLWFWLQRGVWSSRCGFQAGVAGCPITGLLPHMCSSINPVLCTPCVTPFLVTCHPARAPTPADPAFFCRGDAIRSSPPPWLQDVLVLYCLTIRQPHHWVRLLLLAHLRVCCGPPQEFYAARQSLSFAAPVAGRLALHEQNRPTLGCIHEAAFSCPQTRACSVAFSGGCTTPAKLQRELVFTRTIALDSLLDLLRETCQAFVRSLILMYLFACVHLFARTVPLQKRRPRVNRGIQACRCIFKGAPVVLALGAAAYLLPVCASMQHTGEALAEHTPLPEASDRELFEDERLDAGVCSPPADLAGLHSDASRLQHDSKFCTRVYLYQASFLDASVWIDEGDTAEFVCSTVQDEVFVGDDVRVIPVCPQPSMRVAVFLDAPDWVVQAFRTPVFIEVHAATVCRFMEVFVGSVDLDRIRLAVGQKWIVGGQVYVGQDTSPLQYGEIAQIFPGVLIRVFPPRSSFRPCHVLEHKIADPHRWFNVEAPSPHTAEESPRHIGLVGTMGDWSTIPAGRVSTVPRLLREIEEASGCSERHFYVVAPERHPADLHFRGDKVVSTLAIVPRATSRCCTVFLDARDLAIPLQALFLPFAITNLTHVLRLAGGDRPSGLRLCVTGASRFDADTEQLLPHHRALIHVSVDRGCACDSQLAPSDHPPSIVEPGPGHPGNEAASSQADGLHGPPRGSRALASSLQDAPQCYILRCLRLYTDLRQSSHLVAEVQPLQTLDFCTKLAKRTASQSLQSRVPLPVRQTGGCQFGFCLTRPRMSFAFYSLLTARV